MTRCKPRKAHPKCRPPAVHNGGILRLRDDNRWVRDNGDAGLAFIGHAPEDDGAIIWVANCACKVYLDCPVSRALAYAANRYGSATVERRRRSPVQRRRKAAKRQSKR